MVVPMVLLKVAAHWLFSFYKAARKIKTYGFLHKSQTLRSSHLSVTKISPQQERGSPQTLVSDFSSLLRPTSSFYFPYFMLVAFEGGSLIRALLLLLSSPILWALGYQSEPSLRIMTFITFCGLRVKDMELVSRAVLPKFYLENLHLQAYEVLDSVKGRRVLLGCLPRVMFEGFVREYLGVSEVLGTELQVVKGGYFSGLMVSWAGLDVKQMGLKDLFEGKADVGLVTSHSLHDHLFISHCKVCNFSYYFHL